MGVAQWLRVIDTVSNLAEMAVRFRPRSPAEPGDAPLVPGGRLETRLAGVVVAALKEAFDRDRQRMDVEREHIEAERRRAEQALQAEIRRQAVDRLIGQLRLITLIAIGLWMMSAVLAAWLDGMRAGLPRVVLGTGWAFAFASVGCAFAGWQRAAASTTNGREMEESAAAAAAPWLLLCAFVLVAGSLLAGM
jgi:hypothetical protein